MNAISSETAWCVLRSVTGALIFTLIGLHLARYCKKPEWIVKILNLVFRRLDWLRTFYVWIGTLAILGGTWAFFLPIALESGFTKNDDGPVLRQLLIYATGGVLGVITIGETHRKNTLEKTKNEQDHIRQVHAERRSRYTTAIEQLSSDKASIRLGGVYALIGLANEWLADNSLTKEEQYKEGQIIINNLCAYIRSPFSLAERHKELTLNYTKYQKNYQNNSQTLQSREEFAEDKALFQKEGEIRQAITDAIHTHLQGEGARGGLWSHFDYDFSNAIFFYNFNLDNTTFKKSVFFKGTTFTKSVTFNDTEFSNHVTFKEANFIGQVFFNKGSTFPKGVSFEDATFFDGVIFKAAEFKFNIADIEEYDL